MTRRRWRRHWPVLALLVLYELALNVQVYALNTLAMPEGSRIAARAMVGDFLAYFFHPPELAIFAVEYSLCATIYLLLDRMRERSLQVRLLTGMALTVAAAGVMAEAIRVYFGWSATPLKQPIEIVVARNFLLSLTPIGLWAVMAMAFTHNRMMQERDKALAALRLATRDAQLRALHYQLNPHFLFNSLNSLSAMIWERDWKGAEAMVMAFSSFLREVLGREPRQEIELHRELDFQRKYLAIEQIRFGERLEVVIEASDDLLGEPVPQLILQPLVENAIRHAVARTAEPVLLTIRASRDGADLVLSVEDESQGIKAAERPGTGLGLSNVRERLAAQFGARATLRTHVSRQGFTAKLRLPLESG